MRPSGPGMRRPARAAACLLGALLLGSPGPTRGEEPLEASGRGWVPTRLDLEVRYRPVRKSLHIEGTLTLRLEIDASLGPTIGMNGREPLMTFTHVDVEGARTEINVQEEESTPGRLAHVRFARAMPRGSEVQIRFAANSRGHSFQFKADRDLAFASWVEAWYPVPIPLPGQPITPALRASPGITRVRLSHGWRSVSNGRLVSRKDDGEVLEVWEHSTPMARSLLAGRYQAALHRVDGREIGVFLLKHKPASAEAQARALATAMAAMEDRFGPYPYPSYSIAEVPHGRFDWYASSEQGFVAASSKAFDEQGGNLPLFAHEMAHGWWGNLVAQSGAGSIFISEGLAQYGAVLAIEAVEGAKAAAEFLRSSRTGYPPQQCARGYFDMARRGKDRALSELEGGGWQHDLADAKGPWVYRMLRRRVGDETFFSVLRGIVRDYAGRTLALDDLRRSFITAAPEADLPRFFEQWLDRPGAPILDVEWSPAGDGDLHQAELRIVQQGDLYDLDLDVAVDTEAGTIMKTLEIGDRETRVVVDLPARPTGVRIDPDDRILIWKPEYGERPASRR